MDYFPPINGGSDPDRPYLNYNLGSGQEGSIPHAKAIEGPMREILAVIDAAGITRDGEDFTQLLDAINSLVSNNSVNKGLYRGVSGYRLSNNVTDIVNDLDIGTGVVVSDDFTDFIVLPSALTKRLDATFVAGNNNGGLDTGVKANSTTYHIFAIKDPTTSVVDVLFSTSLAPTMPAGFTKKRRIGSMMTTGAGAWRTFFQVGNEFRFLSPAIDVTSTTFGTSATLFTLPLPAGLKVLAIATIAIRYPAADGISHWTDPDLNYTTAPTSVIPSTPPLPNHATGGGSSADGRSSKEMQIYTNTSAQIRGVAALANHELRISTAGFIDERRI